MSLSQIGKEKKTKTKSPSSNFDNLIGKNRNVRRNACSDFLDLHFGMKMMFKRREKGPFLGCEKEEAARKVTVGTRGSCSFYEQRQPDQFKRSGKETVGFGLPNEEAWAARRLRGSSFMGKDFLSPYWPAIILH